VLDVLVENRVPMTVTDIHAPLSPRRANIASIYRTVHLLRHLNLLRSIDTTRRSRRYELTEPFTGHHHHLICQAWGRIEDLDGCVLADDVLARLTRSVRHARQFQVLEHEIRLLGLCRSYAV
jgi:Fe2+ or Zn2+ uptake regulation protein